MGEFYSAQICLEGHVRNCFSKNIEDFCSECGSKTITKCPECSAEIHGIQKGGFSRKIQNS